jgi:tyrosinase
MRTEIAINGSTNPAANYIGWAPVSSRIRLADLSGVTGPVTVRLRNQNSGAGGQITFFSPTPRTWGDELQLTLPANGSPVDFFMAGRFGRPSMVDRDAAIQVINTGDARELSITRLMVRIRKNANNLTNPERDRFLSALARLNDRGMGRFSDFRNIHNSAADDEAHNNTGFLPWHRAFLLDFERELQQIDPSVALPYWRFDQPAPRLFSRDFMGVADPVVNRVQFSPANPLLFWTTDQTLGIARTPRFNTTSSRASNELGPVISEENTLLLGGLNNQYRTFARMEIVPHRHAHTCFGGFISSIDTAARDPLFFLLHANIDRLWAKWQWFNRRFDITSRDSYPFLGGAGAAGATRIGHNLNDTMWPWNQMTGFPRPNTAPGGTFPNSLTTRAPGPTPTVRDMIDYQGLVDPARRLGFDYDDVPH